MRFRIKAIDAQSRIVDLELDVAGEAMAHDAARSRGYSVLSLRAAGPSLAGLLPGPGRFSATLFSIELLALLEAGINLFEALHALAEKASTEDSKHVLGHLLQALEQGEPLSRALEALPGHFSPLYIATVRSSERTGDLGDALARFIAYEEELDRLKKKVVSAAIYPVILLSVGTLVLLFLTFYVVPRFARVYDGMHTGLPFFSRLLLELGATVDAHGALILVLLAGIAAAPGYALTNESVRVRINRKLWDIPALGERMKVYQLARLYRTLGMLLRAGVPVLRAIDMVGGLLTAHLRQALLRARMMLEEGKPVSAAFTEAGLATPIATRMIAVGERGGRMGEMLGRVAQLHDDETARFLDRFLRAFEPILMAVIGLAVGFVIVLMYMPIFELAGSIQ